MLFGIDLPELLKAIGIVGIAGIITFESGVPFGFFLPGDSLLFTAGFLAAAGFLNLPLLIIAVVGAAIIGVSIGYWIGKKFGRPLFKDKSKLFNKKYLAEAEKFYDKYGGRAIIIARFLPVVRTFAPIAAGIAHMDYQRFMLFNVIGALLWAFGLTMLGFTLGSFIDPEVMEKYLLLIIAVIIFLSFVPTAIHLLNEKRKKSKESPSGTGQ